MPFILSFHHGLPLPYFLNLKGWRGCLAVNVLDCQLGGSGFKFRPGQKFSSRFLLHLPPPAKSAMRSTLTVHCQWEDETMRERTGYPPSCAKAKSRGGDLGGLGGRSLPKNLRWETAHALVPPNILRSSVVGCA